MSQAKSAIWDFKVCGLGVPPHRWCLMNWQPLLALLWWWNERNMVRPRSSYSLLFLLLHTLILQEQQAIFALSDCWYGRRLKRKDLARDDQNQLLGVWAGASIKEEHRNLSLWLNSGRPAAAPHSSLPEPSGIQYNLTGLKLKIIMKHTTKRGMIAL